MPAGDRPQPQPRWVRLRSIFGESVVPPESAAVIQEAVDQMVANGDVSPDAKWLAVEYWAADYLSGLRREQESR